MKNGVYFDGSNTTSRILDVLEEKRPKIICIDETEKPLQSRFRKIFLPKYSELEFLDVCEKVLTKLSPSIAIYIGATVFNTGGDIRDVINTGKLVRKNDGPDEIAQIISTMSFVKCMFCAEEATLSKSLGTKRPYISARDVIRSPIKQ